MAVDLIARGIAASSLPKVTSADNGKVLGVVNGAWDKTEGMSLLDKSNMDGSYYPDSFPPYPEIPVLFSADLENYNGAFNFGSPQFMCFLALFGSNQGDVFDCGVCDIYLKGKLPKVRSIGVASLGNSAGTIQIDVYLSIDGVDYTASYYIYYDPQSAETPFISADAEYFSSAAGQLTPEEFFAIVDRIIFYTSMSNDELVFPITTEGQGYYMNIITEENYSITLSDIFSSNGTGRLGNDKLYDIRTHIMYDLVPDDSFGDDTWHCGVSVNKDGSVTKLTLDQWEDSYGNTRYIKTSHLGSSMPLVINDDQNVDELIPANTALMCAGTPTDIAVELGDPDEACTTEYRLTFIAGSGCNLSVTAPAGYNLVYPDGTPVLENDTLYEFSFAVDIAKGEFSGAIMGLYKSFIPNTGE